MQKSLCEKASEMLCCGLSSLNELDAIKEKERKEKEEKEVVKQCQAVPPTSVSADLLLEPVLSFPSLEDFNPSDFL